MAERASWLGYRAPVTLRLTNPPIAIAVGFEPELWKGLLNHKSPDIRLRTLQYLADRRDGKRLK
jgi:hypothetical protein